MTVVASDFRAKNGFKVQIIKFGPFSLKRQIMQIPFIRDIAVTAYNLACFRHITTNDFLNLSFRQK